MLGYKVEQHTRAVRRLLELTKTIAIEDLGWERNIANTKAREIQEDGRVWHKLTADRFTDQ